MLRTIILAICCCAPPLLSACAGERKSEVAPADAQPAPAVEQSTAQPTPQEPTIVSATVEETSIRAGAKGDAVLTLKIIEGYHVNANPASDKFYIPTEITASSEGGIRVLRPTYPRGEAKKFRFSEQPLLVYEGEVPLRLPLSVAADAEKGRRNLAAQIRVQPCNDEACLPPRRLAIAVPVVVE